MRKLLVIVLCVTVGGCASFQNWLTNVDAQVQKYAPVIGKDLIMVANILVTAECSPAVQTSGPVVNNVLNIVAPNSRAATNVQQALAANAAIAAQLCPYVTAIKAQVGIVPQGMPSQVVMPM